MKKKISAGLLCVLTLSAAACAELEVPEGAAGGGADDLAVVTEELGSWSKRYQAQTSGSYESLTSDYFVLAGNSSGGCNREVEVVLMPSAVRLATPLIPDSVGCEFITAVYGTQGKVFVADSVVKKLWRLHNNEAGVYWTLVASTPGIEIETIRANATHVFWSDSHGVHKAPVGGGEVTTLALGGNDLLGLDGSNLYMQRYDFDDDLYTIFRQPIAGGTPTALRDMSYQFTASGFAFNSTHLYFLQRSGNWHRIYKMAKNPGGVSVFAEIDPDDDWIDYLAANETHVYWVQQDTKQILRRAIADSVTSDIGCKGTLWCKHLLLTSSYIFQVADSGATDTAVWRGQL